jgi:large subunit ribosomal protein L15
VITPEIMATTSLVRDSRNPIVVLGRGEVNVVVRLRAHRVSESAKAKIEAAGGSVELVEF